DVAVLFRRGLPVQLHHGLRGRGGGGRGACRDRVAAFRAQAGPGPVARAAGGVHQGTLARAGVPARGRPWRRDPRPPPPATLDLGPHPPRVRGRGGQGQVVPARRPPGLLRRGSRRQRRRRTARGRPRGRARRRRRDGGRVGPGEARRPSLDAGRGPAPRDTRRADRRHVRRGPVLRRRGAGPSARQARQGGRSAM
ncbi:MAG: hypothetical protein AVDCRST_MAG03-1428, partial [uncultured Rubrobacteraceae bacterium]